MQTGRPILMLILGLLFSFSASATHLVGGSITYEYVGFNQGSNTFTYQITFKTYLDCTSPFWGVNFPEPFLTLGIYEGPAVNPPANLLLLNEVTLPLIDSMPIVPELPGGCILPGAQPCLYEATYQSTFDFPLSFQGYHLYYDRCCRNPGTINLTAPDEQGLAFTSWIGPTLLGNSSPVFTDVPVPQICVNDTTGVLNTATDADGDILVFSFVNPYRGLSGNGQNGNPPPNPGNPLTLGWPPVPVTWGTNFNANTIFGPSGTQFINQNSGFTEYGPAVLGTYVTAVEITEYRPPNLNTPIGITRRDMQIIVINCPANPSPNLATTGGSGVTSITIEEGDSLCIPMTFFDPNGDSITLIANGEPLDGTLTNPTATLASPQVADSSLATQFCWNTGCGQGRVAPYFFSVQVTDNGCPPKVTPITFEVTVNPFAGPTVINGPLLVCPGDSNLTYSVDTISGATFNWTITGGTILSGQGTNSINVQWGTGTAGTLSVTTTSQFGCQSAPATANITIQNILADAGPDQSICPGDTVQIGGSPTAFPGYQVSWSPSNSLSSSTAFNPFASPTTNTTYVVTVSDGLGCTLTDSVDVILSSNIPTTLTPDTVACNGDSVTLTATGGTSYVWAPTNTLTNSTGSITTAFPDSTQTYTVTITQANGCDLTDSVTINVILSVPTDAGTDTAICVGDSVALGGSPTGPPGSTFNWSPAGSLNNGTIANPMAGPTNTTSYVVQVADSFGCPGADTVIVTVNPTPNASAGPNQNICPGDTAQLAGSGGGTYGWTPTNSLSDPGISNPQAFPDSTTTYIVTVTNNFGCTAQDSADVIVNHPTVNAGNDLWLCPGDTAQFNATGSNGYLWTPGTTLTDDTISNPLASPIDTTVYILAGDPVNGCPNFDTLTVFVSGNVPTDAGPDTALCLGDTVALAGNPTAPAGSVYQWQPAGSLNSTTDSLVLAFPTTTTTYFVITGNDTCSGVDSVTVTVNALPNVSAGADTAICTGDTGQLAASGAFAYLWSADTTLLSDTVFNPLVVPTATQFYTVTGTDTNGCVNIDSVLITLNALPVANAGPDQTICTGDTAQLNASGGSSYVWSPTASLSNALIANPLAFPATSTTYEVEVTDTNACRNTDTMRVSLQVLPGISAGGDVSICLGDSAQLSATGGQSYTWDPGTGLDDPNSATPVASPPNTTTYIVTGSDSITVVCSNTDTVTVTVNPLPTPEAGANTSVCIGDSVTLQASGGTSYQWTPISTLSNAFVANPNAFPTTSTLYYVTVTDANSCTDYDSVFVTVNNLPVVDAGGFTLGCSNQAITLGGNPTGPAGSTYLWSPAGPLNSATAANPQATVTGPTTFTVTVTDSNSCQNSDSTEVSVFGIEAFEDTSLCINDTLNLTVQTISGSEPFTFSWSPPTEVGNPTSQTTPVFPSQSTTITLTATDNNGCVESTTFDIDVLPLPDPAFEFEPEPSCSGVAVVFDNRSSGASDFLWNFGTGATSEEESPVAIFPFGSQMSATLTAISPQGCSASVSDADQLLSFEDYFQIQPSNVFTPNGDYVNDWWEIDLGMRLFDCTDLKIFNRWGQLIFESSGNHHSWDGRTFAGRESQVGIYFYVLTVNGMEFTGSFTLLR